MVRQNIHERKIENLCRGYVENYVLSEENKKDIEDFMQNQAYPINFDLNPTYEVFIYRKDNQIWYRLEDHKNLDENGNVRMLNEIC
jgi:hypothetical protein